MMGRFYFILIILFWGCAQNKKVESDGVMNMKYNLIVSEFSTQSFFLCLRIKNQSEYQIIVQNDDLWYDLRDYGQFSKKEYISKITQSLVSNSTLNVDSTLNIILVKYKIDSTSLNLVPNNTNYIIGKYFKNGVLKMGFDSLPRLKNAIIYRLFEHDVFVKNNDLTGVLSLPYEGLKVPCSSKR